MKRILLELFDYMKLMILMLVLVLMLNHFVLINAVIPSESMEKTIMTHDRIFGNRLAYLRNDPKRYDIVIFRFPDDERQLYIKRIIGLPGETVEIKNGKVYINGSDKALDDSFIAEPMDEDKANYGPYVVPEGHYFMLGDNRNWSKDSRFWTNQYVARDKILGKAVFRYYPLSSIGSVG